MKLNKTTFTELISKNQGLANLLIFLFSFFAFSPYLVLANNNLPQSGLQMEVVDPREFTKLDVSQIQLVGGSLIQTDYLTNKTLQTNIYCTQTLNRYRECIVLLVESTYQINVSRPNSIIKDALKLKIQEPLKLLEGEDVDCNSVNIPGANIFVVGVWHWNKQPSDGGYASPIVGAWAVDSPSKKFVELQLGAVSCGFHDDKN